MKLPNGDFVPEDFFLFIPNKIRIYGDTLKHWKVAEMKLPPEMDEHWKLNLWNTRIVLR